MQLSLVTESTILDNAFYYARNRLQKIFYPLENFTANELFG